MPSTTPHRLEDRDEAPPTRADIWRSNIVLTAVFVLLIALFIRNANAPRQHIRADDGPWIPLDTSTAPAAPLDCADEKALLLDMERLNLPGDLWLEGEARALPYQPQASYYTLEWRPLDLGEAIIIQPVFPLHRGDE